MYRSAVQQILAAMHFLWQAYFEWAVTDRAYVNVQIALCYYDDNDNELPEPLYECTVCHAKRSEAPSRMGKLQLMLRQMGVYLETYAGNQLVPRIAKLPVEEWGEDAGSAQRLALRNMFGNWVGQEYRVIMAAVQNRMYVNELQPLASKQGGAKRGRVE